MNQKRSLMSHGTILRRAFLGTMAALPAGVLAQPQTADPSGVGIKVAAGESRHGQTLKLPDGGLMFIKVATQDSGGAFFLTEQPSGRKGGPPRHFHLEEDEWFYCLAGQYIVEVGSQRYELKSGDSVLGTTTCTACLRVCRRHTWSTDGRIHASRTTGAVLSRSGCTGHVLRHGHGRRQGGGEAALRHRECRTSARVLKG